VPARSSFDYAVVRVVPHIEREEFINAGVIVHCHALDYLAARIELDEGRLLSLSPDVDVELVRRHLDAIPRVCAGGAGAGPIGQLPRRERWHWLVAPRSTIIQTSPAHAGLCDAPDTMLERLMSAVVRPPRAGA
jgi:Protein of unknown function (DUF3037)